MRQKILILTVSASVLIASCVGAPGLGVAHAQSTAIRSVDDEDLAKARSIVTQMRLDEKMALIRGEPEPYPANQGEPGYLKGIKRFNIPPMRLADGPPGVLTRVPSNALTATMGLAATFSREDARLNGVVVGAEANRLGVDVALQPFVNINRDITFSRAYNTLGEDPVLSGALGASLITGIQSRGVMAQVKHYIGYDSNNQDVVIDPQTLHEVYLAPFDDAVKAGVSSVMCSYNRINGPYACGNGELLNGVLRKELGFKGFVTSDWGAIHDYDYLAKGLDMEMQGRVDPDSFLTGVMRPYFETNPTATRRRRDPKSSASPAPVTGEIPEEHMPAPPIDAAATPAGQGGPGGFTPGQEYKTLYDALKEGVVTESMIDQAAIRVLAQIIRFGYLDGSHERRVTAPSGISITDVIRRTGEDAAVLLKNANSILPLRPGNGDATVLIGPTARQIAAIGRSGERSAGLVVRQVGPYDALKNVLPFADVRLAIGYDLTGSPLPAALLSHGGQPGLTHAVGGKDAGVDAQVDFTGARALPAESHNVWEGTLTVPSTGRYMFGAQTLGARGSLLIDGVRIAATAGRKYGLHGDIVHPNIDDLLPTVDGLNNARGIAELTTGKHSIRYETMADGSGRPVQARLNWVTPREQAGNRAAAINAARAAKTAIIFAWSRDVPKFVLPADQDAFIADIAAANPNTIVVLNTSQPVAMPWIDKVRGVIQMWWPGDEGGWATANILAGKKNPAGRLPVTWAERLEDYAPNDPAHPERMGDTADHRAVYSEGVDVGYRWFDRIKKAPRYPFGYGLSYTKFDYSSLSVANAHDGGVDVRFTIRNTGKMDGEDVPQVYVSAPAKPAVGAKFASNALAGFDRVFVPAGGVRAVTIHVDRRRTQYWSLAANKWVDAAAGRTLSVGASSRDLRLATRLK